MESLRPGTKSLKTLADFEDYVAAFNVDDFEKYTAYYHPRVFMNIGSLAEKTLKGYVEWLKPLHSRVTETLIPQKIIFDREGKYVVCDFHTEFRGKNGFTSENFLQKWGPVHSTDGPLVKMVVFYHLDGEGHITQLEPVSSLLKPASPL